MRDIRQIILGASSLMLIASCGVKNNFTKNNYSVTPSPLEVRGDSVVVFIDANIPPKSINSKVLITFKPYLKTADGSIIELKESTVRGEKSKAKADETVVSKTGGKVSYKHKWLYQPNMKRATLYPKFIVNGKNVEVPILNKPLAEGMITTALLLKGGDMGIWATDDYKVEPITKSVNIYFPVDVHKFNPKFKQGKDGINNKMQIEALKNLLQSDPSFVARGIAINAYASPDGELSRNSNLSKGRAESTFNYFKKELKKLGFSEVNDTNFSRGFSTSEDWTGFEKAIVASEFAEKDAMLAIIRNSSISDEEREGLLKRNHSKTWMKAKESILPSLRRSELIVNGASPMKTEAELAALYGQYDKLDNKELFHLALITTDMAKKSEVLNAYIAKEANDWRAYNDLGLAQIRLSNNNDAKSNLEKALSMSADNGVVLANMGVMFKAQGDFANAEKYYVMAAQKGAEVSYNMGLLAVKKGTYDQAVSSFDRSNQSDFNVALAHLMNGNSAKCISIIDALNPDNLDWSHYYLRAVANARTNNLEEVVKNIARSVSMNENVRGMVKEDIEFMSMWSNPLFQGAIR